MKLKGIDAVSYTHLSFVALNKKYGGYEFYPLYVQDFAKLYIVDEQTE